MATREDEADRWRAISRNSRKAAQHLLEVECYRSSVSRAYYAAYAAITSELIRGGITLGYGGGNPGHAGLPVYVLNNLTTLPMASRYEINKAIRRLYRARLEADYVATAAVDEASIKRATRDMGRVLQILGTDKGGV